LEKSLESERNDRQTLIEKMAVNDENVDGKTEILQSELGILKEKNESLESR